MSVKLGTARIRQLETNDAVFQEFLNQNVDRFIFVSSHNGDLFAFGVLSRYTMREYAEGRIVTFEIFLRFGFKGNNLFGVPAVLICESAVYQTQVEFCAGEDAMARFNERCTSVAHSSLKGFRYTARDGSGSYLEFGKARKNAQFFDGLYWMYSYKNKNFTMVLPSELSTRWREEGQGLEVFEGTKLLEECSGVLAAR
jgi:hypothetical protein